MSSRKWNSIMVPDVPMVLTNESIKRFLDDNQRMLNNLVKLLKTPDDDDLALRTKTFFFAGNASVAANVAQWLHVNFSGTITKVRAYAKTGPVGSALILDVNKNGTTIWSTQANRVTIAAGENAGEQTSFNSPKFVSGDIFTLDIDQVGSGTAGADITVEIEMSIDI